MSRHLRIALGCAVVIVAMTALVGFSLPLYRAFCEATGLGGTTRRADAATRSGSDAVVEVRFNTDVAPDLPWRFGPVERSVHVRLGQPTLAKFWAENRSDTPIVAHATYNVTPDLAGRYFNKIQCFCFNEERLSAHERVEMPVLFFVDPAIANDRDLASLPAITLSYMFFRSADPESAADLARFGASMVAATAVHGDASKGAAIFASRCAPCHALDHNKAGPMLGGIDGRHAGSAPGFAYSAALGSADIVWQTQSLDKWLANPGIDVPGTRMPAAVNDPQARADLIAYLLVPSVP